MTTPFSQVQASTHLPKENVQSLLQQIVKIEIYRRGEKFHRLSTVEKIYCCCQKKLQEIGVANLTIKGSAVSQIFSKEPYHDIDMHSIIDLTRTKERDQFAKGYGLKWSILQGIIDALIPSTTASHAEIGIEDILFEEDNIIFAHKGVFPFNIHTLRIGDPQIEFTCTALIKQSFETIRSYDFNSGALQLHINTQGDVVLESFHRDIDETLQQISEKKLVAIEADKIDRKGLARYLVKVHLSGYTDPSEELFSQMMQSFIQHFGKEKNDPKDFVENILMQLTQKGMSSLASGLALWVLPKITPFEEEIFRNCQNIVSSLSISHLSEYSQFIKEMVCFENRAELCWYLLLHAGEIHIKEHRMQQCLQVELDMHPLFTSDVSLKKIYIIFPLESLSVKKMHAEKAFFHLIRHTEPRACLLNEDVKEVLKKKFAQHLAKKEVFPILAAVFHRFDLSITKAFVRLFYAWADKQNVLSLNVNMSKVLQKIALETKNEDITTNEQAHLFLDIISQSLPVDSLYEYNQSCDFIITSTLMKAVKQDLCSSHKKMIDRLVDGYMANKDGIGEGRGDFDKEMISFIHAMYTKSHASYHEILTSISMCLINNRNDVALKLFKAVVKKEESLDVSELTGILTEMALKCSDELTLFLLESFDLWTQKVKGDLLFFFLKVLDDYREKNEQHLSAFLQLCEKFCSQEQQEKMLAHLFLQNDCLQHKHLIELLCSRWQIYIPSFISMEQLSTEQISFLIEIDQKIGYLHPSERKDIFLQLIRYEEMTRAESFAFYLAREDRETFLDADFLDSCYLHLSATQWLFLAKLICELIPNRNAFENFAVFFHALMNKLSDYRDEDFSNTDGAVEAIRWIHKTIFLYTAHEAIWSKFWNAHVFLLEKFTLDKWIDTHRWKEILWIHELLPQISKVFSYLNVDPQTIFAISEALSQGNVESEQIALLLEIFSKGENLIWHQTKKQIKIPPKVVSFLVDVLSDYISHAVMSKLSQDHFSAALNGFGLCAWHADSKTQEKIIHLLIKTIGESSGNAILLLLSGKPDRILMHSVEKSLEDKNFSAIVNLYQAYIEFFSVEGRKSPLSRREYSLFDETEERFSHRCNLWESSILDFQKYAKFDEVKALEETVLHIFYMCHLSDLIFSLHLETTTCNNMEYSYPVMSSFTEKAWFEERMRCTLGKLYCLFERIQKKKKVISADALGYTLKIGLSLQGEDLGFFTEKSLTLYTHISRLCGKNKETTVAPVDLIEVLFRNAVLLVSIPSNTYIHRADVSLLSDFLQIAVETLGAICSKKLLVSDVNDAVSYLQNKLSIEKKLQYFYQWAISVIDRKENVSYEELSLLTVFVLKNDETSPFCTEIQRNLKTSIITPKFFKNSKNIEIFLSIFDIGFKRFSSQISTDENCTDVFSLFTYYWLPINDAIVKHRDKSELLRFHNMVITLLEYPICSQENKLSSFLSKVLLNFCLAQDEIGNFYFRHTSKAQLSRIIRMFFYCVKDFVRNGDLIVDLRLTSDYWRGLFNYHYEAIKKTLTKTEMAIFRGNIEILSERSLKSFVLAQEQMVATTETVPLVLSEINPLDET